MKEIEVPRIRIYENSGTIKSTYIILTPYVKENNLSIDNICTAPQKLDRKSNDWGVF